jgi:thiol-disulfide isomerase/thioredoxin
MKLFIKLLTLVLVILFISCKKEEVKDYVTIKGEIKNHKGDEIVIKGKNYLKKIKLNEDGTFKDTLKLPEGQTLFQFFDGSEYATLFLENGYDLTVKLDDKEFDETITFQGKGAESSSYLAKKTLFQEKLFTSDLFDKNENEFNQAITDIEKQLNDFIINNEKGVDSVLIAKEKKALKAFKQGITGAYKQRQARKAQFADLVGKQAPQFVNYESVDGKKVSLKDLKGKNVYIDIWATWCGPCKVEIPSLKKLEEEYKDKNIAFVSISVDEGRGYPNNSAEEAKKGWKKMIADKQMGGIQLFADKAWNSDFIKAFKVRSIPRFILIDKNGLVVNADAPRPSSSKIKNELDKLL